MKISITLINKILFRLYMLKYEDLPRELDFFSRGLTRAKMKRLGKTWGRRK